MSTEASTAPTATNEAEAVGEAMGAKIVFYAAAKAAGMNDSATMDDLAAGVCSRIDSGAPESVGQWLEDTFGLTGDVAAAVAVAAIEFQCPEFSSLVGS